MPSGLLETALGALRLSVLFVVALFLPLILQLLLLFGAGWLFHKLSERVPSLIFSVLSLIGTPVHEFSHAIASLITLCRVGAITPLPQRVKGGWLASVATTPPNFVQGIVIGLAPLFGGTFVLWLTGTYIVPGFDVPIVSPPQLSLESAASLSTVMHYSIGYLRQFLDLETIYRSFLGLAWDNWRTLVGLYVALSVGISIAPSSIDLKHFAKGLPLLLILILGLFAWLYVSGDAESVFLHLQTAVVSPSLQFSTAVTYAFVLTVLGVAILLPLRLWRKWQEA